MVVSSYIFILTISISIFLLIVEIGFLLFNKEKRTEEEVKRILGESDEIKSITRLQVLKRKWNNSELYKNYYQWLDTQLELSFEEKDTPSSIIQLQTVLGISGIVAAIILYIVAPYYVSLIALVVVAIAAYYPAMHYKSKVQSKNKAFGRMLPAFINQTIMVMKVGVSMDNAFGFGLQSMEESLARREFEKLVAEMKIHTDDVSQVFLNLSKRIQTEECDRFCNIIVSGLKNGNKMSDILKNEHERMTDNELTEMRKSSETKKTLATVINIILVFIPAILLLIIPMMRIGELA